MFDDEDDLKKTRLTSVLVGLVWGAAFWIFIDGQAYGSHHSSPEEAQKLSQDVEGYSWLPLVAQCIAFVMITGMKWSDLTADIDENAQLRTRLFLIFAILVQMGALAGAVFLAVGGPLTKKDAYKWNGIAILISNIMAIVATWVQRFVALPTDDE